jgi:hypothetical protein
MHSRAAFSGGVLFSGVPMAQTVKTEGQILLNGDLLEILRNSKDAGKLTLLHFDGNAPRIGEKLKLHGETYVPLEFGGGFLEALRLPSNVEAFGSAKALVTDLTETIRNFTGLEHHLSRLTAFYFMMTWFCDCLGTAPRLSVIGPPSRAVDQFMRLAAAFCRHGILLASISPSGLLSLPFSFGLTLLLRQRQASAPLMQLLDAATKPGHFVPRNGKFVEIYSPIVLQSDRPLDESTNCTGLDMPLWPARQDPPLLDRETEEALAQQFQSRLLAFRLANFTQTRNSRFDTPDLSSPAGDAARSLGVCFSNEPDLQGEIVSLLRTSDTHARVLRTTTRESLAVEALLFHVHEAQGDLGAGVHVGLLAKTIEVLSTGRGDPIRLSPRAVGQLLRSLNFTTGRLDRNGRGIVLLKDIVARVHEVAWDRQVPSLAQGAPGCAQCQCMREVHAGGGLGC